MTNPVTADVFQATMQSLRAYIETSERDILRLEKQQVQLQKEISEVRTSLAEAREHLASVSPKRSKLIDQGAPAVGGGALVAAAVAFLDWLKNHTP